MVWCPPLEVLKSKPRVPEQLKSSNKKLGANRDILSFARVCRCVALSRAFEIHRSSMPGHTDTYPSAPHPFPLLKSPQAQRALCSHHTAPEKSPSPGLPCAGYERGRAGKRFPPGQAFLGPYAVRGHDDLPLQPAVFKGMDP